MSYSFGPDMEKKIQDVMSKIESRLMTERSESVGSAGNKVTVVGAGQVGMACAFALLAQNVTSDLALIDVAADKLQGEMMDLQHGACFMNSPKIQAGTDFALSADSKICIVAAGVRQKEGESRLNLVQRNLEVFKGIIPQLVSHSPNTILLIVSNPVDILTYASYKLSGLPRHKVIGSGTNLDSARLRQEISQRLHVSVESCDGWVIGEHGDSSVAVWSGVQVGGVNLSDVVDTESEGLKIIHKQVVDSAYEIIRLKGYTNWAVGLSSAKLCAAILRNAHSVHAVSTAVKGFHGIDQDVYLSLPCVLGRAGVTRVVRQPLTDIEAKRLRKSAEAVGQVTAQLDFKMTENRSQLSG